MRAAFPDVSQTYRSPEEGGLPPAAEKRKDWVVKDVSNYLKSKFASTPPEPAGIRSLFYHSLSRYRIREQPVRRNRITSLPHTDFDLHGSETSGNLQVRRIIKLVKIRSGRPRPIVLQSVGESR